MTFTDIVLILILLWAGWKGFSKGLVIEVASLISLILGVYAALHFSGFASDIIQKYVEMDGRMLRILSFAFTFIVVVLLVILIGRLLEKVLNLVMLGFFNKILGSVFSILKVAVVLSVLMMLMNLIDPRKSLLKEEKRQESWLYQPVESIVPRLQKLFHLDEDPLRPVLQDDEPELSI